MLTLFTIAKPFRGLVGTIQMNALSSWVRLCPPCEVILLGDEEGSAQAAQELGLRHIPQVERNEHGTPLVSSVFEVAQRASQHELLSYVNADIVMVSDLLETVREAARLERKFLIVGRRWDVDIGERLDFDRAGWEQELRSYAARRGRLHEPTGLDYFVFTRGVFDDLPPFALGRTVWDNWLIYRARSRGIPVIDATRGITAVHQNHGYSHHPQGEQGVFYGAEAKRNLELAGGTFFRFTIEDATHRLTSSGLELDLRPGRVIRRAVTLPLLRPRLRFLVAPAELLAAISRPLRRRVAVALRRRERRCGLEGRRISDR
jgi:hypothetical protein